MLAIEKVLLKASLICSLVGIGILIMLSESHSVDVSLIKNVTIKEEGTFVKVGGEIERLRETPSVYIFTLKDSSGSIKVIAWRNELLDLVKGEGVDVEGVVKVYEGEIEIEAKLIRVIRSVLSGEDDARKKKRWYSKKGA